MRYRVERERTDHGYGPGWVVLDHEGDVLTPSLSWATALGFACHLARRAVAM